MHPERVLGQSDRSSQQTKVQAGSRADFNYDISLSDAELFWIIDNGIKLTGMPALGPAHSDGELWAIVAFVKRLRQMTPEEYQSFQKHLSDEHSH